MTRRILYSALSLALAIAFVPSAVAGDLESADPDTKFYAAQRTRYESGNNYFDGDDDNNDRYNFWATRTVIGMKTMLARDVWSKSLRAAACLNDRNTPIRKPCWRRFPCRIWIIVWTSMLSGKRK